MSTVQPDGPWASYGGGSMIGDESPLNHLDITGDELPQTGEGMKALIDGASRCLEQGD